MSLKENIKKRRKELGLTLEDVAKHVEVSRQTIQKYESGVVSNIPSDKIEKLAEVLKTTPAWLMGWEYDSLSGQNLKNVREKAGLNQREFCEAFNNKYPPGPFEDLLTERKLAAFESGDSHINYDLAIKFSELLDLTPDVILCSLSSYTHQIEETKWRLAHTIDQLNEAGQSQLENYVKYLLTQSEYLNKYPKQIP